MKIIKNQQKNDEKPLNILAQGAQGDREKKHEKNRKKPKMTENEYFPSRPH